MEILSQEEVGSFIVRDSTTHPGCFALSVRVPKFENSSGISHYLILKTHRGVRLKVSILSLFTRRVVPSLFSTDLFTSHNAPPALNVKDMLRRRLLDAKMYRNKRNSVDGVKG